jgi:hypothetical protein
LGTNLPANRLQNPLFIAKLIAKLDIIHLPPDIVNTRAPSQLTNSTLKAFPLPANHSLSHNFIPKNRKIRINPHLKE